MADALHLKYRPEVLDDLAGNEAVKKGLQTLLNREAGPPHAFLFHGPSGCGKTTLARIIRKALNCSDMDYYELDTASVSRGIGDVRRVIQEAAFTPVAGPCKVYLFDECHKITGDGKEALLKFLEDTPRHVFVILCTTEPEKLLKTIHTRCTTYEVKSLSRAQTVELLTDVANKEGVQDIPDAIFELVAKVTQGCPRDAVKVLDQIIDLETFEEMEAAVASFVPAEDEIIDLCRALSQRATWPEVAGILKGLFERGQEPEKIRYAILGYFASVALNSKKYDQRLAQIGALFEASFMYSGKAGLVNACGMALTEI